MALPTKSYSDIHGDGGSDIAGQVAEQQARLAARLGAIDRILLTASGKGGVGKSTVATNLAAALAKAGSQVGLVDADLEGATAARMLGASEGHARLGPNGVLPADVHGVRVMSTDLLRPGELASLGWLGPVGGDAVSGSAARATIVREFFADTAWGRLDNLIVDLPSGADFSLLPACPGPQVGMIMVTLPGLISLRIVTRAITAARAAGIRVLGLVVNMAYVPCDHCGKRTALGDDKAVYAAAESLGLPVLATLPWDAAVAAAAETGVPAVLDEGAASHAYAALAARVLEVLG